MHVLPCRLCGSPIQIPAKYARATSADHPDGLDFDRYWDEYEKNRSDRNSLPTMRPNAYFLIGLALAMLTSAAAIAYGTNRKTSDLPPTPVSLSHHGHADGSHTGI